MTLEGDIEMNSGRFSQRFSSDILCQKDSLQLENRNEQISPCLIHPDRQPRAQRICNLLSHSVQNCRNRFYCIIIDIISNIYYNRYLLYIIYYIVLTTRGPISTIRQTWL